MSRSRGHRLRIIGALEAMSPVHVGGMHDSPEVDLPLARDGQDRLYIPGTALAGCMRQWTRRRFNGALVTALWGSEAQDDRGEGGASRAFVDDAVIITPPTRTIAAEVWDGVGIDREYGRATNRIKFDRAVLPRGSMLTFAMTVDLPREDGKAMIPADEMRAVVGNLIEALCEGRIGFGAGQTRGLGKLRLSNSDLKIIDEDWGTRAGVLALLRGASPTVCLGDLQRASPGLKPNAIHRIEATLHWQPAGPLMVKAAREGVAVDALPFVSAVGGDHVALALPGSAIKGAFRSQSERIVRTVLDDAGTVPWRSSDPRDRHLKQLAVPIVTAVFGSAKRKVRAVDSSGSVSISPILGYGASDAAGAGALSVDTCFATARIETSRWEEAALAEAVGAQQEPGRVSLYDALLAAGLRGNGGRSGIRIDQAFHVAVDRWTGGAAEHLLFSGLEPLGVIWEPIRLTLDLDRLGERDRDLALALLLFLFRDLAEQRFTIGYGANRGYGAIAVTNISFAVEGRAFEWLNGRTMTVALPDAEHDETFLAGLPLEELERLESRWRETLRTSEVPR